MTATKTLPTLKRRLLRLGIGMATALAIIWFALVWLCAKEIAAPSRRAVNASHLAYFDGTARAGFTVEKFVSSDGMPCLVCTPERMEQLSKKAEIIRGQLVVQGVSLKPSGEIIGTVLILHGRSGIKEHYLSVAERFCAVGLRCIIPDLPGHGSNPQPFTTYGVLEAPMILKCYNEVAGKYGFSGQPCGILGQSMGGAEAIHTVALEGSPFGTLVVVSTFDKLETVIRGQADSLLGSTFSSILINPAGLVYRGRTGVRVSEIQSSNKARSIFIPTLVVHGNEDKMIPTESGKDLFKSFPRETKKKWLEVPGAEHNNVLVTDFPLYALMTRWFLENLKYSSTE